MWVEMRREDFERYKADIVGLVGTLVGSGGDDGTGKVAFTLGSSPMRARDFDALLAMLAGRGVEYKLKETA